MKCGKVHVFWEVVSVKSTVKISSIFVVFLKTMNFNSLHATVAKCSYQCSKILKFKYFEKAKFFLFFLRISKLYDVKILSCFRKMFKIQKEVFMKLTRKIIWRKRNNHKIGWSLDIMWLLNNDKAKHMFKVRISNFLNFPCVF